MKPVALNPGDCIGVMAPSSIVEKSDIEKSKVRIEKLGYNVFIHPQTYEQHNQSAGTSIQKIMALQGLWQRDDIKAIWLAGGGNRSLDLLDSINFKAMKKKPKAIIGFSDSTTLLNSIYAHTGFPTFHGTVFKNVHKIQENQLIQTLDILRGINNEIPLNNVSIIKEGEAEGILIGGCLSLFQYLISTEDCAPLSNAILFLEDTNEHLSRIDRMLLHLKRRGVFKEINALILGEFCNMQESDNPFGFELRDLIEEYTKECNIPIIMNAPFGHGENIYTLPIGTHVNLKTTLAKLSFLETSVTI
ncbi:MAG: LD-carboxypeptidase [Alphaproteobacteria bacterium]|nr:LD-carboxypeptidase [Alphaproteobacteria bacterium]